MSRLFVIVAVYLRELLTNPKAIHEARALLAEQVGKFTLERVEENVPRPL